MIIQTRVQNVATELTKNGKTVYKVKLNGQDYVTFEPKNIEGLQTGMVIEADVNETQDGKYTNRYFNGWELAMNAGEAAKETMQVTINGADVPPDVWEAKDRRIAMESAAASAARFMQALAVSNPTQVTLANYIATYKQIYEDVLKAGNGE